MKSRSSRIGLGTVQWGMAYGVGNHSGCVARDAVKPIIETAKSFGIRILDTAALYGDAEDVLGEQDLSNILVVTKTPKFERSPITAADVNLLNKTFECSLSKLGLSSVHALLLHNVDDLFAPSGGMLIDAMCFLRDAGKIEKIGVSVYDATQLKSVLDRFTPDVVQLPLNVFDQRLLVDGSLSRLKTLGVEIHVRSVFLQGLLLMDPNATPAYFDPWRQQLHAWRSACLAQGVAPQHAAISFVCDQPEVDCCLIGVQSRDQLLQSLEGLDAVPIFETTEFACNDVALLNPANWKFA